MIHEASSSQKRHKESQGGGASKKHKRSHKNLSLHPKKIRKPADLEKMSSLERIAFLQEKLQDIRNHYLLLKSEVASIDRRRKRMKKKERESECGQPYYSIIYVLL
ncbi:hypothetical protein cypCar_00043462 [Cyprinus carpio]|nr:hypothetical protein cypCar_00043462 [Cyprinus carpio]